MHASTTMTIAAVALATLPLSAATQPDPVRFDIDTGHSYVGFSVRHLVVGTVKGRFTRFSGTIMLDEANISQSAVTVTIEAASIDTGHERRDSDLRGADFFNVEQFPNLTFAGKRIDRDGDALVLVGDLTIRDVTKEVRIPFELSGPTDVGGRKRLGAEGALRINRHDYGITWNRLQEAVQVAGDEVRIELSIEAATPRQR